MSEPDYNGMLDPELIKTIRHFATTARIRVGCRCGRRTTEQRDGSLPPGWRAFVVQMGGMNVVLMACSDECEQAERKRLRKLESEA